MDQPRYDPVRLSKTLSHALRHSPEQYGLTLDPQGWVPQAALLASLRARRPEWAALDRADLEQLIIHMDKQRFELDGERIRARYGHSTVSPIERQAAMPPATLFHGTGHQALARIWQEGLRTMRRQYVHLSEDAETAWQVGQRRGGKTVILLVAAGRAHADGICFYPEAGGIWLADPIPAQYLSLRETSGDRLA